jgi:hypothetical protein
VFHIIYIKFFLIYKNNYYEKNYFNNIIAVVFSIFFSQRSRINAKHFAKWDFYNNQWGNYANSIAYFDPTIIIKKLKKLKRSITDIIDRYSILCICREKSL